MTSMGAMNGSLYVRMDREIWDPLRIQPEKSEAEVVIKEVTFNEGDMTTLQWERGKSSRRPIC